jgi:gluconokinase
MAAIILMGVTGSGKTTIGESLAAKMGCAFFDGDDYHPAANVEKMRCGEALNDADRTPWLDRLRELVTQKLAAGEDVVLACSALREKYRQRLRPGDPALAAQLVFVYLRITPETSRERLRSRPGHFMPVALVDSQFNALEEPLDAVSVDASQPPDQVLEQVLLTARRS